MLESLSPDFRLLHNCSAQVFLGLQLLVFVSARSLDLRLETWTFRHSWSALQKGNSNFQMSDVPPLLGLGHVTRWVSQIWDLGFA